MSPDAQITFGLLCLAIVICAGGFGTAMWLTKFAKALKEEIKSDIKALIDDEKAGRNVMKDHHAKFAQDISARVHGVEKGLSDHELFCSRFYVTKDDINKTMQAILTEIRSSDTRMQQRLESALKRSAD